MRSDCAWMRSSAVCADAVAASSSATERSSARRDSSEYPRIDDSGVRSSWLASATNCRMRSSLRWRTASEASTWSSSVFSAAPTRPVSVRGSASAGGTRSVIDTSPRSRGWLATRLAVAATSRSGRSASRIVIAVDSASRMSPPIVVIAMTEKSVVICASVVARGSPVTTSKRGVPLLGTG